MTSDETLMFFSLWKRFSVGGSIYIIARLKIGTRISEVWLYERKAASACSSRMGHS